LKVLNSHPVTIRSLWRLPWGLYKFMEATAGFVKVRENHCRVDQTFLVATARLPKIHGHRCGPWACWKFLVAITIGGAPEVRGGQRRAPKSSWWPSKVYGGHYRVS